VIARVDSIRPRLTPGVACHRDQSFLAGILPMADLSIPTSIYRAILEAATAGYPEEVCGLIAGKHGQATRHYPVENVHHSPVAFEMEPVQQVKAMVAMEEEGLDLLAIYHSHPGGPAWPSATDVAKALYPDVIQIIISLENRNHPRLAAFRISDGNVWSMNWTVTSEPGI
jgi:[CysO sulfur-carrier protein]-S-L-cysteine hydrolase